MSLIQGKQIEDLPAVKGTLAPVVGLTSTNVQAAIEELAAGAGGGGGTWGSITGTLSDQADLQAALNAKVNKAGDTMTGQLILPAGIAGNASFRLPHGVAPTTPVNGDLWTTTTSLSGRINGVTRTFLHDGNAMTAIAETVTQAAAEAGVETVNRWWTAQRVRQAIVAYAAPISHVHAASDITSGTFNNTRIAQSNVTQHQAALSIAWSQLTSIPDFGTRWPTWGEVTDKPVSFPPAAHNHIIADVTGLQAALDTKVNKAGDTMTGTLILPAGIAGGSSIRLPHGVAPTTPVNGDLWTTTVSLIGRISGVTRTFLHDGNAMAAIAETVSQAAAEAGAETINRWWTAERVRQAITAQAITKLGGFGVVPTPALTHTGHQNPWRLQAGDVAATTIYDSIFPSIDHYDVLSASLKIAGGTIEHAAAISGYVTVDTASAPNGVALFGAGRATVNNAAVWGINTLLQDSATRAAHVGTGRKLVNELDFNVMSPSTELIGLSIGGNSLAQPSEANGFLVNTLSEALGYRWGTGFWSLDGAAIRAFVAGVAEKTGTDIDSQDVWWQWRDGAGTKRTLRAFVDAFAGTGFFTLTGDSAWALKLAAANLLLDNGQGIIINGDVRLSAVSGATTVGTPVAGQINLSVGGSPVLGVATTLITALAGIDISLSTPVYTSFLHASINLSASAHTVPVGSNYYGILQNRDFTIPTGLVASLVNFNLALKSGAGNLYGVIGALTNESSGSTKALYGRAIAGVGCTGVVMGLVGGVRTRTGVNNATAAQLSVDSFDATPCFAGVWVCSEDGTPSNVEYGVLFDANIEATQAFIQAFAKGSGDFLRLKNASGDADLFRVTSTGRVASPGSVAGWELFAEQAALTMHNNLRAWQWQAVNAGDYYRLIVGGVGDAITINSALKTTILGALDVTGDITQLSEQGVITQRNNARVWQWQALNTGDLYRLVVGGIGDALTVGANLTLTAFGRLQLASTFTAGRGQLNIPNIGTMDPGTPVNGDLWQRSDKLYARLGGTTYELMHSGSAPSTVETVSQAEAEAGTATINRWWTAERVRQAIVARNLVSVTSNGKILTNSIANDAIQSAGGMTIAAGKLFSVAGISNYGISQLTGIGGTAHTAVTANSGYNLARVGLGGYNGTTYDEVLVVDIAPASSTYRRTTLAGGLVAGTDPGGAQFVRFGGTGRFSGLLTLDTGMAAGAVSTQQEGLRIWRVSGDSYLGFVLGTADADTSAGIRCTASGVLHFRGVNWGNLTAAIFGADPGGAQLLRVGGSAVVSTNLTTPTVFGGSNTGLLSIQAGTSISGAEGASNLLYGTGHATRPGEHWITTGNNTAGKIVGFVANVGTVFEVTSTLFDIKSTLSLVLGTDPGGGQRLRVGGTGRFGGLLTLDAGASVTGNVAATSFSTSNGANAAATTHTNNTFGAWSLWTAATCTMRVESTGGSGVVGTTTAHDLLFISNNATRGRITSAGDFVIGTDPTGGQRVRVGGTGRFSGLLTLDAGAHITAGNSPLTSAIGVSFWQSAVNVQTFSQPAAASGFRLWSFIQNSNGDFGVFAAADAHASSVQALGFRRSGTALTAMIFGVDPTGAEMFRFGGSLRASGFSHFPGGMRIATKWAFTSDASWAYAEADTGGQYFAYNFAAKVWRFHLDGAARLDITTATVAAYGRMLSYRNDAAGEGGYLSVCRSSDNAVKWRMDCSGLGDGVFRLVDEVRGHVVMDFWGSATHEMHLPYLPAQTNASAPNMYMDPANGRLYRSTAAASDEINVKNFGAAASPADSTTAFQAAINATADGGTILVPGAVNYLVTVASLTVGTKFVRWDFRNGATINGGFPTVGWPGLVKFGVEDRESYRAQRGKELDYTHIEIMRETDYAAAAGTPGWVNSALRVENVVNAAAGNSFEWGAVFNSTVHSADNVAEQVAAYARMNKMVDGRCFGIVAELSDHTTAPTRNTVSMEVDAWCNGADTNGQRIGVDVVVGKRVAGVAAEATAGVRIHSKNSDTTEGRWYFGVLITSLVDVGILFENTGTHAMQVTGTMDYGLDMIAATINEKAIRIPSNKAITFDNSGNVEMRFNSSNTYIEFLISGVRKGYIDLTGSDHAL